MLKRFIGSVRRKPRAIREGVALWGAIALSATVALVWLYHMPARFTEVDFALNESDVSEQNLIDDFQSQLSAVREGLPNAEQIDLSALEEEQMRERADAFISEQMASSSAQNQASTSQSGVEDSPQTTRTPIRIITTSSTASSSQISR